jgi:hypothetical protein
MKSILKSIIFISVFPSGIALAEAMNCHTKNE